MVRIAEGDFRYSFLAGKWEEDSGTVVPLFLIFTLNSIGSSEDSGNVVPQFVTLPAATGGITEVWFRYCA